MSRSLSRQRACVRDRDVDISGGDFSDIPGGPWKAVPPSNYDSIMIVAVATRKELRGRAGALDFRPFGAEVRLTVEYRGVQSYRSESKHIFHMVSEEFELLMIIDLDVRGGIIACRGSEKALLDTVRQVDAAYSSVF